MKKSTQSILSKVQNLLDSDEDEYVAFADGINAYYDNYSEEKFKAFKRNEYKSEKNIYHLNKVLDGLFYFQEEELDQFIHKFESRRSNTEKFIDDLYYALMDDEVVKLLSEKVFIGYKEYHIRNNAIGTRVLMHLYKRMLEDYDYDYDEGNPCIFMRQLLGYDDDDDAAAAAPAQAEPKDD